MRERFTAWTPSPGSRQVVNQANDICASYREQGYNLTLRQLYYQFVARDLIPNRQTSYKRLGSIVNDARLAGLLDWSYLEDRGRNVEGSFYGYDNPGAFIESVRDHYSEAVWDEQHYRPEVWVEKEALVDVVARATSANRVPHFACKGYVSQSEMYSAAKRFQRRRDQGHVPVVIHLGDHDPSGLDMSRDIEERLALMAGGPVELRRIALNMDQIEQYGPPPNPAKITDSRFEGYQQEYGDESWELDALEPNVLAQLIADEVDTLVDSELWDEALEAEQASQARLDEIAERWQDLDANWNDVLNVIGSW